MGALRLFNVGDPALVVFHRVDRNDERLGPAPGEFTLQASCITELRRADGCEVSRVGKENHPVIACPFVEPDAAFCCIRFKVGRCVADQQAHLIRLL